MDDIETGYLLNRAHEEAVAAIRADHPSAAAAHQRLSLLYSTKAIIELAAGDAEDKTGAGRPRFIAAPGDEAGTP